MMTSGNVACLKLKWNVLASIIDRVARGYIPLMFRVVERRKKMLQFNEGSRSRKKTVARAFKPAHAEHRSCYKPVRKLDPYRVVHSPHQDAEQRVAGPKQLHLLRHEVFLLGFGFPGDGCSEVAGCRGHV